MLAALVAPIAAGDPSKYAMLASTAAVMAGLIFLAGGILKLGSVSEFISKPVLKGFVFGLALTIMVKQVHKLTGIPGGQGNFFHQTWHAITSLRELNLWTTLVGVRRHRIYVPRGKNRTACSVRSSGAGVGNDCSSLARPSLAWCGSGWQDPGWNAIARHSQNQ
jgi:hypothetical protein